MFETFGILVESRDFMILFSHNLNENSEHVFTTWMQRSLFLVIIKYDEMFNFCEKMKNQSVGYQQSFQHADKCNSFIHYRISSWWDMKCTWNPESIFTTCKRFRLIPEHTTEHLLRYNRLCQPKSTSPIEMQIHVNWCAMFKPLAFNG